MTEVVVRLAPRVIRARYDEAFRASRLSAAELEAEIARGFYDRVTLIETSEWQNDFAIQYLFDRKFFKLDYDIDPPSFEDKLRVFNALWRRSPVFTKPIALVRLLETTIRKEDEDEEDDGDQEQTFNRWIDTEYHNYQSIFHVYILSIMTRAMWRGVADIVVSNFVQGEAFQRYMSARGTDAVRFYTAEERQRDANGILPSVVLEHASDILTDDERERLEDRKRVAFGADELVSLDTQLRFARLEVALELHWSDGRFDVTPLRDVIHESHRRICRKQAIALAAEIYNPQLSDVMLTYNLLSLLPCAMETLSEDDLRAIADETSEAYRQRYIRSRTTQTADKAQ